MPDKHPINQTLLELLINQEDRARCALLDLDPDVFARDPGNGCNSIQRIGEHLISLRGFTLLLMRSDLAAQMPDQQAATADELRQKLDAATALVRKAIESHDPADWHAEPTEQREGPWPELPTLIRVVRPFNDFANHLGAIRAIRRIMGDPIDETQ